MAVNTACLSMLGWHEWLKKRPTLPHHLASMPIKYPLPSTSSITAFRSASSEVAAAAADRSAGALPSSPLAEEEARRGAGGGEGGGRFRRRPAVWRRCSTASIMNKSMLKRYSSPFSVPRFSTAVLQEKEKHAQKLEEEELREKRPNRKRTNLCLLYSKQKHSLKISPQDPVCEDTHTCIYAQKLGINRNTPTRASVSVCACCLTDNCPANPSIDSLTSSRSSPW